MKKKIKSAYVKVLGVFVFMAGSVANGFVTASTKNKSLEKSSVDPEIAELYKQSIFGTPMTIENPDAPIHIVIDGSIPKEYYPQIESAVNTLRELFPNLTFELSFVDIAVTGDIKISEMNDRLYKIFSMMNPDGAVPVGVNMLRANQFTAEMQRGGQIFVNPDFYYNIENIIIHESGHALGIKDNDLYSIWNSFVENSSNGPSENDYEYNDVYEAIENKNSR